MFGTGTGTGTSTSNGGSTVSDKPTMNTNPFLMRVLVGDKKL